MVSKRKRRQLDLEMNLCCNPFRKRRCGRPDIEVYISYKGEQLPICSKCWTKIADKDWDSNDSKDTFIFTPCIEGMKIIKTGRRRK